MQPKKKSATDVLIPVFGFIFSLYIAMHLSIAYQAVVDSPIVTEYQAGEETVKREQFDFVGFLQEFSDQLTERPAEFQMNDSTPKFLMGVSFVYLIIIAYFWSDKRNYITGKEFGTSGWAGVKDIKHLFSENILKRELKNLRKNMTLELGERVSKIRELKKKYINSDIILTSIAKICLYNYELNAHALVMGGAGSGKSRGFICPNCLNAYGSYLITDPKSEILNKVGYFFLKIAKYKVKILNLDEKHLSHHYNPFVYVHRERENWEARVLSLIEVIIINTDGGEKRNSSDPFWEKSERLFLQALFFATVEGFPVEECNMNTVMMLIRMLEIPDDKDDMDSDLDLFFEVFREKYGEDHIAVEQYYNFRSKARGRTAQSIVISAIARLAPFSIKQVKEMFAYDEMELDKFGEEKTAIFVVVPPTDKTFNFIAGCLFSQLQEEINYTANVKYKEQGQRLPIPARFLLDEFATTCVIPGFIDFLAYARSLGCSVSIAVQSLDQLKHMYKEEWPVILDNCNSLLYLGGVKHSDTLKYLSELLGKGTFDKKNTGRTRGRQSSASENYDKLGRELFDSSEVHRMNKKYCLLFLTGYNPIYSRKFDYERHKNYKYTSDANKKYIFRYEDLPEKEIPSYIKKNTHREDEPVEQIELEMDVEKVFDLLQKTSFGMESLEFDDVGETILNLTDTEIEELNQINQISTEESNVRKEVDDLTDNLIAMSLNPEEISEVASLLFVPDFEVPADPDEEIIYIEEIPVDLNEQLDNLIISTEFLTADINNFENEGAEE